jgi:hypothetical protein
MKRLISTFTVLVLFLAYMPTGVAQAESIPPLQWPSAVVAKPVYSRIVTSPAGDVTVGCSQNGAGQDLVTYNAAGALIRQIPRTTQIDGVSNCIGEVVVDKNNVVYGVPYGQVAGGGSAPTGRTCSRTTAAR